MYNVGSVYEIIGRVLNGTYVVAYVVRHRQSKQVSILQKQIIEQLALNKQIYNCSAQVYKHIVNLKGINCKLSELPKYDMNGNEIVEEKIVRDKPVADLKLVGKIQDGRTIKAYVIESVLEPGKKATMPRDYVMQLAKDGRFVNAKSQMNGDALILRGDKGFSLSQLQTYN